MYTTRVSGHVGAPRADVYRALVSAEAVARWRVPAGMSGEVHEFDAREAAGSVSRSLRGTGRHRQVGRAPSR
ncbi:SRPBCC domain-containing protein [Streptomyces sp. NPDC050416]|uniref:SRPBCC domain-containing protein n=1 Tax=Streptomyces sp. NPDC050416 TaxID=3365611 RepID=UPI00379F8CFE